MFIFLIVFSTLIYTMIIQLSFFWKLHLNFKLKTELVSEKFNYKFDTLETPFKLVIKWFLYTNVCLYIMFTSISDISLNTGFEHFKLTNTSLWYYFLSITINICLFYIFLNLKKTNLLHPTNFFYSIGIITLILPFLAFINNFYTFYFLVELGSLLFFYKFITSRCWYKNTFYTKKQFLVKFNSSLPQQYINALFFQYWNSFFSSTVLLYVIINFLYLFTTTNFILFDFLTITSSTKNFIIFFLVNLFLFAAILKFGVTPIHLFKLEVYKGLSIIVILFYTIYILLFFVQYIFTIFIYYMPSAITKGVYLITLMNFLGTIYLVVTLFTFKNIKSLFALSTTINILNFFWGFLLII